MINLKPLFPGTSETDELKRIFKLTGTPSVEKWPGLADLPNWKVTQSLANSHLTLLSFI